MTTWAIGDLQGCYNTFKALLERIDFVPGRDRIWLAGDLINRGPDSLGVLRWCYQHQEDIEVVLGNHDLHFLAVAYGAMPYRKEKDTFDDILAAPDCDQLVDWLRRQPLMHADEGWIMAHAGIYPGWSLGEALEYAGEVEDVLISDEISQYFKHMYGNAPERWEPSLEGYGRTRFIVNAFTRMRLCDADGTLDLRYKKGWKNIPQGFSPWFQAANRRPLPHPVLFGHWAAIDGDTRRDDVVALDTGCVWGGRLTACRLEDGRRVSIRSEETHLPEGEAD
jgi:bis(5'-nucleosyl)-tetraphosphatase (symmetrical)